jgi:hypothetical protein
MKDFVTINVRLPGAAHTNAKSFAAQRGETLKQYVIRAVIDSNVAENFLHKHQPEIHASPTKQPRKKVK